MPTNRVVEHLDVVEHVRGRRGPGRVDPPLDPLLFQDAEEALGHRVVVAVPAAAHARHHPVHLQERLPVAAGELAALVGVHHDARSRLAPPCRRHQGLQHQVAGHRRRRGPTHDLPRVQVHHRRQEQPALVGADVGDVGDPDLVRRVGGEVAVEHVVDRTHRATAMSRLAPVADLRPQTLGLHQPLHAVAAAGLARFAQVKRDLAVAIHATAGQPEVLDQPKQPLILALTQAGRLPDPGVVAAAVHAQHPAHRDQSELADVRTHERVLRPYPKLNHLAPQLGIESLLDKYPYEVSGGQKQRAAVARALITHPQIILADEPTGALDSKSTDDLLNIFDHVNEEGQTIVMVTHSTKAASFAKRVLFIRDGQVYHQIYKGDKTNEEMYQAISDTLTLLQTGGK